MSFRLYRGSVRMEYYPKKASTEFDINDLVYLDSNGQLDKATASTDNHIGFIQKEIRSTDSDYAANTKIGVMIPDQNTEFKVGVGTGTAAATNVGEFLNLTDEQSVDVTSGSNRAVLCTKVISASEVVVKLNSTAVNQPSVV